MPACSHLSCRTIPQPSSHNAAGPTAAPCTLLGGCRGGPPTGMITDKGLQDHTAFDILFVLLRHNKSCSGVLPKYKSVHWGQDRKVKEIPGVTGKKHCYLAHTCSVPFHTPCLSVCLSKPSVFGRQPPPPLPACASWTLD